MPIEQSSELDQQLAMKSYSTLNSIMDQLSTDHPEIEIRETGDTIRVPVSALRLLGDILKGIGQGKSISVMPLTTEISTQTAAELLGCSRPHLVKLLDNGYIPFYKVGKHRRIRYQDIMHYKRLMKEQQRQHIIDIMDFDEEIGLYESK